jgi:hypothetical protein
VPYYLIEIKWINSKKVSKEGHEHFEAGGEMDGRESGRIDIDARLAG